MSPESPPLTADQIEAVLLSKIAAEYQVLHPGTARGIAWTLQTHLDDPALGINSLDRMALAAAVNEWFALFEAGIEDSLLARRCLADWHQLIGRAQALGVRTINLRTSGTTGAPKVVAHHLDRLRAEARFWADVLAPVKRIIALVPAHHIYGFIFTVLLPHTLGCPVVRHGEAQGALQGGVGPGDVVVGLPEWWHYLLTSGAALGGGNLISSTAPCPEYLRRGVMAAGAGSLLEVYGSTETAGIGYRFEDQQAYALLPLWQRDGQAHGLHDAAPTEGTPLEVALQDHLTWLADDRFVVGARLDGCLPIAGSKVNPAVVVACLQSHPMVARCTVQAVETPAGMRLGADVVPSTAAHGLEAHVIEARLAAFCQSQLPAAAQPAQWTIGAIPSTAPMVE